MIKDFEVLAGPWSIILPQGASKEVLDWYSIVFAKAAENPKIKEYFAQNYFFTYPGLRDPGKFKEYVYKERARNKPVIKFIVDSAK